MYTTVILTEWNSFFFLFFYFFSSSSFAFTSFSYSSSFFCGTTEQCGPRPTVVGILESHLRAIY
jgi:hypothetical protein